MYNVNMTYEQKINSILNGLKSDVSIAEGSYTYNMVAPLVYEMFLQIQHMKYLLGGAFIQDGYDEYLDKRLYEFGLYRKQGSLAYGSVDIQGTTGEVLPAGTKISSNTLNYILLYNVTLPATNVMVKSEDVGSRYNRNIGTLFRPTFGNLNISRIEAVTPIQGGVDIETDDEFRERFEIFIQNDATSGNVAHYKQWALEVVGVGKVRVLPLWNGNGTVKVLVADANNQELPLSKVNEVYQYILEKKPIGCELTVDSITPLLLDIVVTVNMTDGYFPAELQPTIIEDINEYIRTQATMDTLYYSKIYSIIGQNDLVEDIVDLTINGQKDDISLSSDSSPVLNTVSVREVI